MPIHLRTVLASALLALAVMPGAIATAAPARSGSSHAARQALPPIETNEAGGCEFIADPGNGVCMLPFPDDYYTVADPSSPTGRRVDFKIEGMPANAADAHIEAGPYNASDGFSPGSVILLKVPGINTTADVRATKAVPVNRIGRYSQSNAPVVVIDAQTGARQLHLRASVRRRATTPSPNSGTRTLRTV